ncbi:MAG: response regulator [Balneolaceae bacterium]
MSTPIYIILAEDDTDDAFLFNEAIDELSLAVDLTIVSDGERLMQSLTDENIQLPDVIFLDINMPRKNGLECLSEIRVNNRLHSLPVIIFSTSFDEEIVSQLYINGADYYIQKPSGFEALKNVIHLALNLISEKNQLQPPKDSFVLTDKKAKMTLR